MGKPKDQKVELMNSFSRMNYLFQATVLTSKIAPDSILSNYYGQLMREVSKKVVEKIHPNIKRSLCSSCSYPLFTNANHASVKIKPHKKKKYKKKVWDNPRKKYPKLESIEHNKDYGELKKNKKNFKPNKLIWSCNKCGFTRSFPQRSSHSLWIDIFAENGVVDKKCQAEKNGVDRVGV